MWRLFRTPWKMEGMLFGLLKEREVWGREKERGREWKGGSERVVSVVVVALLIRLAAVVGH